MAKTPQSTAREALAEYRLPGAPHLVALVRAGARFECGRLTERSQERAA